MFLAKNRNPAGKAAAFPPKFSLNSYCHLFSCLFIYCSKCVLLGPIPFNKSTHFVGGGYSYCWASASVKLMSNMYVIQVFVGFEMFFVCVEREAASFVESIGVLIQKIHFFGNLIQGSLVTFAVYGLLSQVPGSCARARWPMCSFESPFGFVVSKSAI
jgi:hypothetical protein